MIFTPNMERADRKRGKTAQWMAQAIDAPIPIMSAFINFMDKNLKTPFGFTNDLQR